VLLPSQEAPTGWAGGLDGLSQSTCGRQRN
jgi:hypothetical protein